MVVNGTASNFLGGLQSATNATACPSSYNGGSKYGEEDFDLYSSGYTSSHVTYTSARICLYEKLIATEASLPSSPDTQFSAPFTITANGQQETLNISNVGSQSATSSDGKVQINWVGSLVTGNQAPDGSQYVAISNAQSNNWVIQTLDTYQSFSSSQQSALNLNGQTYTSSTNGGSNLLSSCSGITIAFTTSYINNVANCLNNAAQNQFSNVNQDAQSLLSGGTFIGDLSSQVTTYQNQPAFVVTLPSYFTTTNPLITLRISGSFIGVVIPEGTPKIISVTSSPFNSGNNGTINVQVENVGNSQGAFYTSLSNCGGISTSSSNKYAVSPGQTQAISIPIFTSSFNQSINEQCTVTVTDYNGGGSDSAQVNVVAKQANQCTPNAQVVSGSQICSCSNVNGIYEPSSCITCQNGVVSSNGQYVCAKAFVSNETSNVSTSLNTGNLNSFAGSSVVQSVVGASTFISCTPFVGDALNSFLPGVTTVADIISSLSGNSCG